MWNNSVPTGELLFKEIATNVNNGGIRIIIPITYAESEPSDVRTKELWNLPLTRCLKKKKRMDETLCVRSITEDF